jgi:hypothetical protein
MIHGERISLYYPYISYFAAKLRNSFANRWFVCYDWESVIIYTYTSKISSKCHSSLLFHRYALQIHPSSNFYPPLSTGFRFGERFETNIAVISTYAPYYYTKL